MTEIVTSNLNGENTQNRILRIPKPAQEGVFTHPLHLALTRPAGPRE